jgi:hypothetical protein
MGADLLDAAGAHAHCCGELEYRAGMGTRGDQWRGRSRHSNFRRSLSHGPVQLYRDSCSVSLLFSPAHSHRLLDMELETIAKAAAARIGASTLLRNGDLNRAGASVITEGTATKLTWLPAQFEKNLRLDGATHTFTNTPANVLSWFDCTRRRLTKKGNRLSRIFWMKRRSPGFFEPREILRAFRVDEFIAEQPAAFEAGPEQDCIKLPFEFMDARA